MRKALALLFTLAATACVEHMYSPAKPELPPAPAQPRPMGEGEAERPLTPLPDSGSSTPPPGETLPPSGAPTPDPSGDLPLDADDFTEPGDTPSAPILEPRKKPLKRPPPGRGEGEGESEGEEEEEEEEEADALGRGDDVDG